MAAMVRSSSVALNTSPRMLYPGNSAVASTSARVGLPRPRVYGAPTAQRSVISVVSARSNFDWEQELQWEDDSLFETGGTSLAPAAKVGGKFGKKGKGKKGRYNPAAEVTSMNAMEDAMYEDSIVEKKVKKKAGKLKRSRGGRGATLVEEDFIVDTEVDFLERSYA